MKENNVAKTNEQEILSEPQATETVKPEKKKKSKKKTINTIINVVLIVAIIFAAISTYISFVSSSGNGVPNIFGLRILSIQTDSMYDTLVPGDLIVDVGVDDPGELRKNDIITYWTVINGEKVLNTHRIVNIYSGGDYLIFETKGDNNTAADPLTVHESKIVGKYAFRIPSVGKVFDYLQTSKGFLLVVLIPVFIFFIFHLVQFFRVLFEYQNIKNRIKYEQERSKNDDSVSVAEANISESERARLEEELREKLRAEILASMAKDTEKEEAPAETTETEIETVSEEDTQADNKND